MQDNLPPKLDDPNVIWIERARWMKLQRDANINNRPLVHHLLSAIRYLGIGALVHAWFLGTDFHPQSMWSWGYLAAWPIPLGLWLLTMLVVYGVYIVALVTACGFIWLGYCSWLEHRDRRVRAARRARERGEIQ